MLTVDGNNMFKMIGFRTPLIIHDRTDLKSYYYDFDYTLGLSDWYHDEWADMWDDFYQFENRDGVEVLF